MSPMLWVLGLLCLLPGYLLPSHLLPWTAFQQECCAAVAVALLAAASLLQRSPWRWPALAAVAALAAIIPLLQVLGGLLLYAGDGALAALYLLAFGLSIAVGAQLTRERPNGLVDGLTGVFVAVAIASVGLALCQWLDIEPPFIGLNQVEPGARPGANIGQPNHLATLLLLGLIGAGWLFQRGRIGRPGLWSVAIFLCVGMALTQSRQVWVGLLLVAAWTFIARRRAGVSVSASALPLFAVTLAALIAAIGPLDEALSTGAGRSLSQLVDTSTRRVHWESMVDAARRSPWVGYGWNEISVAQAAVAPDHPATHELLGDAHNLLLDLLLWNGVPLGILLFGVLVWWVWRHLGSCRDAASAFMLASLLAIGAHALFEYPLSYAYFLLPAGLMVGIVDARSPIGKGIPVPRGLTEMLMLLAFATLLLVCHDYIGIEADHREMRMEKVIVSPYRSPESAPSVFVLDQWRELLVFARSQEPSEGMSDEEIKRMRSVALRFPQAAVLRRYATAAGLNGRPEEARIALVKLCKMHHPARCAEARSMWAGLQRRYPQLLSIGMPEDALQVQGSHAR